ncbi:MAG: hypothetical protein HC915_10790 [Anaerolineae bacterium]|nr:hypothetical protein [Anaerolineae bacterium]
MDIQRLVDRLEDLIDEGRHIPMSKYTLIDEERILSIIDQMRISVPEQIEEAARVIAQRDRLIAQANEEAAHLIEQARQKSRDMTSQEAVAAAAELQARQRLDQVHLEAERIRAEADGYVLEVLRELESHLLRTLTVVRNGIAKVAQDREGLQQARAAARRATAAPPGPPRQKPPRPCPSSSGRWFRWTTTPHLDFRQGTATMPSLFC